MGQHFGELIRIKGITYYTLSPHEQRAFAGIINPGLKNVFRRTRESLFLWGIPLLVTAITMRSADEYHHKINRKNPADYANDV